MMVFRLKIRGTIKDALSVTKKMFSNELFSVPYIRVFPVTFPLVISSPPAMKAGGDVPFGLGLPGRRPGIPALAQASAAYALEMLPRVGSKMFGSQVGATAWDEGSTDQVSLEC
jgi:hypothetical protein